MSTKKLKLLRTLFYISFLFIFFFCFSYYNKNAFLFIFFFSSILEQKKIIELYIYFFLLFCIKKFYLSTGRLEPFFIFLKILFYLSKSFSIKIKFFFFRIYFFYINCIFYLGLCFSSLPSPKGGKRAERCLCHVLK